MISETLNMVNEPQRNRIKALLYCLGYNQADESLYSKGYVLKERAVYKVEDGMPRILPKDLSSGISEVQYKLNLQNCEPYRAEFKEIINLLEESANG